MTVPHKSRIDLAQDLAEKAEKIKILEADNKRLTKESLNARIIRKEIFKLSENRPTPPSWMTTAPKNLTGPGVPILLGSDFHWGETIDPDQINGVNKFNCSIAHKRAKMLFETTVTLLKRHMVNPVYPGIIFCLGGDLISGNIHEELLISNDATPMEAVLDLRDVLIAGIDLLINEFGKVVVPCVSGNHGRTTLKMPAKDRNYSNFDWLLSCLLEKHYQEKFGSESPVVFLISEGVDQHFKVYNTRFLLTHGDSLGKGGDGIIGALGPIIRGDQKTRSRNIQIAKEYDVMLCGHYHQLQWLSRVITNGSLCGYNEYASNVLRAPYEPPRQALFCVHPEHGITYQMPINLDIIKIPAKQEWVSWPKAQ